MRIRHTPTYLAANLTDITFPCFGAFLLAQTYHDILNHQFDNEGKLASDLHSSLSVMLTFS